MTQRHKLQKKFPKKHKYRDNLSKGEVRKAILKHIASDRYMFTHCFLCVATVFCLLAAIDAHGMYNTINLAAIRTLEGLSVASLLSCLLIFVSNWVSIAFSKTQKKRFVLRNMNYAAVAVGSVAWISALVLPTAELLAVPSKAVWGVGNGTLYSIRCFINGTVIASSLFAIILASVNMVSVFYKSLATLTQVGKKQRRNGLSGKHFRFNSVSSMIASRGSSTGQVTPTVMVVDLASLGSSEGAESKYQQPNAAGTNNSFSGGKSKMAKMLFGVISTTALVVVVLFPVIQFFYSRGSLAASNYTVAAGMVSPIDITLATGSFSLYFMYLGYILLSMFALPGWKTIPEDDNEFSDLPSSAIAAYMTPKTPIGRRLSVTGRWLKLTAKEDGAVATKSAARTVAEMA